MDLKIIEFRNAINKFVETSDLPEEVKRMVLEQCLAEQDKRTLDAVRGQIEERDKKEAEESAESV